MSEDGFSQVTTNERFKDGEMQNGEQMPHDKAAKIIADCLTEFVAQLGE